MRKIYEGEAYKFYRQSDKVPPNPKNMQHGEMGTMMKLRLS